MKHFALYWIDRVQLYVGLTCVDEADDDSFEVQSHDFFCFCGVDNSLCWMIYFEFDCHLVIVDSLMKNENSLNDHPRGF